MIMVLFVIYVFNPISETIILGYTDFSDDEIRELVKTMGDQFKGYQYHLLHKNCNHFCDSLSKVSVCPLMVSIKVNWLSFTATDSLWERYSQLGESIGVHLNVCPIFGTMSTQRISDACLPRRPNSWSTKQRSRCVVPARYWSQWFSEYIVQRIV